MARSRTVLIAKADLSLGNGGVRVRSPKKLRPIYEAAGLVLRTGPPQKVVVGTSGKLKVVDMSDAEAKRLRRKRRKIP